MASHAVGLFYEAEEALQAAGKIKSAGLGTPELMSPIPLEGVEEVLGPKKSVIRRFTLFGGIAGALSGFALAAITASIFPHPTGGRPIIAFPPFLIITYELTILFGIIATVIGFFISARFPALKERVYVPEAAVDRFAVTIPCPGDDQYRRAESILRESGADEIRQVTEGSQ